MEFKISVAEKLLNFNCNCDETNNNKLKKGYNHKIGGVIVVPSQAFLLPFIGNKITLAP